MTFKHNSSLFVKENGLIKTQDTHSHNEGECPCRECIFSHVVTASGLLVFEHRKKGKEKGSLSRAESGCLGMAGIPCRVLHGHEAESRTCCHGCQS